MSDEKCGAVSDEKCGTYAGWNAHNRAGERPCAACRRAANNYTRDRRAKKAADGDCSEIERHYARERAVWRLAKLHPAQYQALVSEEIENARAVGRLA